MATHDVVSTMTAIERAWQAITPAEREQIQADARAEWAVVESTGDIYAMTEWLDANASRLSNSDHRAACERICRRTAK